MDAAEQLNMFRAERDKTLKIGNAARLRSCELDRSKIYEGAEVRHVSTQIRATSDTYRKLLPELPISRCPFTGELLNWAIDTIGIDGWFWEYENPNRRYADEIPLTYLAFTGAMRVVEPITWTPFACEPGPGAPYVLPEVLQHPEVGAVIVEIPVGKNTGWTISYFGPRSADFPIVPLPNEWGSYQLEIFKPDGSRGGWNCNETYPRQWDFDLAPWVKSGKLRWIAPRDDAMTLRTGTNDCPYLDIDGPRVHGLVERGTLRYPALEPRDPQ